MIRRTTTQRSPRSCGYPAFSTASDQLAQKPQRPSRVRQRAGSLPNVIDLELVGVCAHACCVRDRCRTRAPSLEANRHSGFETAGSRHEADDGSRKLDRARCSDRRRGDDDDHADVREIDARAEERRRDLATLDFAWSNGRTSRDGSANRWWFEHFSRRANTLSASSQEVNTTIIETHSSFARQQR
jgi:hypothetical protein